MDAAQALNDLTEISSQIEAAALFTNDGSLLASTLADAAATDRLVAAAQGVVEAAQGVPRESDGGPLVQLEAALEDGSLFIVCDAERSVAAVTSPDPTAGLVFFDLKSCLGAAMATEGDGKPRPRPRRTRSSATKEASGEGPS